MEKEVTSRLSGFYKLDPGERFDRILESTGLASGDLDAVHPSDADLLVAADHMIENVIGVMSIPLGVATNFTINGSDLLVPMATEESSVVAAASNAASMARVLGGFTTSSTEPRMIAQVQVVDVADPHAARLRLLEAREELLSLAEDEDPTLARLGGGPREVEVRVVRSGDRSFVVLHLIVDVRDAMGANAVNTMAEALAPRISELAGGRVLLRILSNKADRRLARSRAVFDAEKLGGSRVVDDILDAFALAAADPYRAATHNKGVMNGISAVVLATGNDTRAVEAAAHSHACTDGGYGSLSHFEKDANGNLVGTLELPMPVGLVGGATKVHPVARAAIRLLGVQTARELAEVIVSVGLAQNLAAIRALATEGIQQGHMSLHARNVAVAAGAQGGEIDEIAEQLIAGGRVRGDVAEALLGDLRARADR